MKFPTLFLFVMLAGCGGAGEEGLQCPGGGVAYQDESGAVRCFPAPATDASVLTTDAGPSVDSQPTPDAGQPDVSQPDLTPPPDTRPPQDAGPDLAPPPDAGRDTTADLTPPPDARPAPDAGTPDLAPTGCTPGAARACGSDVGECEWGGQFCQTDRTWSPCFGGVGPVAEVCNGLNDDCDGYTDEYLGFSSCGMGACVRTVQNCLGGVPQTCTPGAPAAETCNGLDDDCDGTTDEGCASPTATARVTWTAPAGWVVDDVRHNITAGWVELPVGGVATYFADFAVVLGRPYIVNGRLRNTTTGEVAYFAQYTTGFGLTPPCAGVAPSSFGTITFAIGARVVACTLGGAACVANATCTP